MVNTVNVRLIMAENLMSEIQRVNKYTDQREIALIKNRLERLSIYDSAYEQIRKMARKKGLL